MIMTETQKNILQVAENEFMSYGFQKASLRNIAKKSGLTTGAVYGYYSDKESLFSALVSEPADELLSNFKKMCVDHSMLSDDKKVLEASQYAQNGMSYFCEFICKHRNAFYLIANCSEGTKYRTYIDEMIEIEEKATHEYFEFLINTNKIDIKVDDMLMHMLISSFFESVFEVARHEMTKSKAIEYANKLAEFYIAGWHKILGF